MIHLMVNSCTSLINLKMNPCVSNAKFMAIPMPYPLFPHRLPPVELEDFRKISMEKFMAFPLLQDIMASMAIIAKSPQQPCSRPCCHLCLFDF